jgi:hypothetical protein
VTTNHALQWIQTARFSNSKVERWALKLQEYQFDVVYKKGVDNTVADCLSRSVAINIARMLCHKPDPADFRAHSAQVLAMTLSLTAQPSQPIWPGAAARQRDLDDVPCCICLDAAGHDNMVICDGCQRCFHLRCLTPPACSVPQGAWHCPACEHIVNSTDELYMQDTPLRYRGVISTLICPSCAMCMTQCPPMMPLQPNMFEIEPRETSGSSPSPHTGP